MDSLDLLKGVQDNIQNAAAEGASESLPGPLPDMNDFKMPSMDQMLEIIETLDMPAEEKENLKKSLLERGDFMSKMAEMGAGAMMPQQPSVLGVIDPTTQYIIFFAAVFIIGALLGK